LRPAAVSGGVGGRCYDDGRVHGESRRHSVEISEDCAGRREVVLTRAPFDQPNQHRGLGSEGFRSVNHCSSCASNSRRGSIRCSQTCCRGPWRHSRADQCVCSLAARLQLTHYGALLSPSPEVEVRHGLQVRPLQQDKDAFGAGGRRSNDQGVLASTAAAQRWVRMGCARSRRTH